MAGTDKEEHEDLNNSSTKKRSVETNVIINGDCKNMLKMYKDNTIDLIYMDPPFFSNKSYEILWGNGFELKAYEDRWKGGIQHYIEWMKPVIEQCHRVLKETGSMYLHCDWHANAHLRILMDEIFGEKKFRNEIIWFYSVGGKAKNRWASKHDNIYLYTKSNEWTFNGDAVKEYAKRKTGFESFGGKIRKDKEGRLYQDKYSKPMKKYYRYFLDEGKIPEDVWEIQSIQSQSKERLGYPTQKPETLLERIIKASSNPTDIVLDPMVGGGTTIVVAHRLGRRWIGIDVSPLACKLSVRRLRKLGATPVIIGGPMTKKDVMNLPPFEFQKWVCDKFMARMTKKVGDMGIDGWTMEMIPIQAKQSEGVGRNVIDNFETAIKRKNKTRGIIIAFSFGRGAYEEVARAKQKEGLEIELKTVDDLLK